MKDAAIIYDSELMDYLKESLEGEDIPEDITLEEIFKEFRDYLSIDITQWLNDNFNSFSGEGRFDDNNPDNLWKEIRAKRRKKRGKK